MLKKLCHTGWLSLPQRRAAMPLSLFALLIAALPLHAAPQPTLAPSPAQDSRTSAAENSTGSELLGCWSYRSPEPTTSLTPSSGPAGDGERHADGDSARSIEVYVHEYQGDAYLIEVTKRLQNRSRTDPRPYPQFERLSTFLPVTAEALQRSIGEKRPKCLAFYPEQFESARAAWLGTPESRRQVCRSSIGLCLALGSFAPALPSPPVHR